ncbi:MAG: fumarate hydratase [Candidatus Omnitrophica bacterium]|nr:fumarate hydratase [Candidatus Omnitrophota bacterium]MCM8828466.1 fumarate hydratase [Candidatus Omnitrophota bacterium]
MKLCDTIWQIEMRMIKEREIIEKVYLAIEKASFSLEPHIRKLIYDARRMEKSIYGKEVLNAIVENIKIAEEKKIPLCQDTGMVVLFFEIGSGTKIEFERFKSLQELVDFAVKSAYTDFYLRKSVVSVPDRKNTMDNTPSILWCESIPGDSIRFSVLIKGFGSENTSRLKMFLPSTEPDEIVEFVADCVKKAGANPCPPVFIGIGMGGTAEKAMYLSKKALVDIGRKKRFDMAYLEKKIISRLNQLGIGPGGLGGTFTCLDARIRTFPTHIAGFPVAVSISCWAHRMHQGII